MTTVKHDPATSKFTAEVEGQRAELDYVVTGSVMRITHTRVPKPIEGRGVAAQLMQSAVALARDQRWSIDPVCSYAAAYLKRRPPEPPRPETPPPETARQHAEGLLDEALEESFPASDSPSVGGST